MPKRLYSCIKSSFNCCRRQKLKLCVFVVVGFKNCFFIWWTEISKQKCFVSAEPQPTQIAKPLTTCICSGYVAAPSVICLLAGSAVICRLHSTTQFFYKCNAVFRKLLKWKVQLLFFCSFIRSNCLKVLINNFGRRWIISTFPPAACNKYKYHMWNIQ